MAIRVYEPGEAVEFRQGSGQPWRRGVYAGPIEDLPGDHWLEGGVGVSGRHLRPARVKAKPSRPERPRRPTTGAHIARAHSLEAPEGVRQEKPQDPARSSAYLAFVRTHPCCACGEINGIHAHHHSLGDGRGMAQKVSDYHAVPLCEPRCHSAGVHSMRCAPPGMTVDEWCERAARTKLRLLVAWIERGENRR